MTPETLTRAVRIAKVHAHPIGHVHMDHLASFRNTVSSADLGKLAAHSAFARPLHRAVSTALDLTQPTLTQNDLAVLETDTNTQNIFDLVALPQALFDHFIKVVAAVRLHGAILKCVLKSERQRLQAILGDAAFNLAIREAPLTYPALNLNLGTRSLFEKYPEAEGVPAIGATFLAGFVRAEHPNLSRMLTLRLPTLPGDTSFVPTDGERAAFRRLLQDRVRT